MKFNNFSNLIFNLDSKDVWKSNDWGIFYFAGKTYKSFKQSPSKIYDDYWIWRFELKNGIVKFYDYNDNFIPSNDFALLETKNQNKNLINFNKLSNFYHVLKIKNRAKYFNNLIVQKKVDYYNFNNLKDIEDEFKKFNYHSEDPETIFLIDFKKKVVFYQYLKKLSNFKKILQNVNKYFILKNIADPEDFNLDNFDHQFHGISNIINNLKWQNENYQIQKIINNPKNLHLKNAFLQKLQNLKKRQNNLLIIKKNLNFQNQKTINSFKLKNFQSQENNIEEEISKFDFKNNFEPEVKNIIFNSKDNYRIKINLISRLNRLKKRNKNLLQAKNYFDSVSDLSENNFFKIDGQTIIDLENEIKKIDIFDQLNDDVKKIITDKDNFDLKNNFDHKINQLKLKKVNFEFIKNNFNFENIKPFSYFETINQKTIEDFQKQVDKINFFSSSQSLQEIINHQENFDLKNDISNFLKNFDEKKANLESAKTYFDLTNVKDSSHFNKADQTIIDLITDEITKLENNYIFLSTQTKRIVELESNLELKKKIQKSLQNLKERKIYIKKIMEYFDQSKIAVPSSFNRANQETINLISKEVEKMNDYDLFQQIIKDIINHDDNLEFKKILQERFNQLRKKKKNLELAKTYFDLTDVENPSFFNKADQTTIDLITSEINKINDYDDLLEEVKTIVNHIDNLDFKNALNTRLQELEEKKANLESVKTYFDLTNIQDSSNFNKANDETIDLINQEIVKINNYQTLEESLKEIVDHSENSEFNNLLQTRLEKLQEKKANLELAKTYFDLTNVQIASSFNKADDETIDLINQEITKIDNYNNLSEDVKVIVEHNDNSEYKNALNIRLHELTTKKTDLKLAQKYFNVLESSNFNRADQTTIKSITTEINKINDYDNLSEEIKAIVDHDDNLVLKNSLNTRLHELQTKKANLELAQTYFNHQKSTFFNKANNQTIDLINQEINKILNDYDNFSEDVKAIIDHSENLEFKNELQELETKVANLELAKGYFDLTDVQNASFFNKADQTTIKLITDEINKNNYNTLTDEIKAIVDHNDNLEYKNVLNTRLQELEEKKANLESVKTYFDLTGVQNPSIFNKADQTTIDLITSEINKINDYDNLSEEIKAIVDHDDNLVLKNSLNTRLHELQTKKANLELAQTYFNHQKSTFFNKANNQTIDLINQEINKILNDYDNFSEDVKTIIDHSENLEFKNELQKLQAKNVNLESAQIYFDLIDIQNPTFFNKANDQTIDLIDQEILKINDYVDLSENVKTIVDHDDNSEYKKALNTRLQELTTKKTDLELAQIYFDLTNVENTSFFNKADDVTINLIDQEINKINDYDDLSDNIKAIVDHDANLEYKNTLNTKLQDLKIKKTNLESVKTYFDLNDVQDVSNFNKANDQTITLINQEISKINDYDDLSEEVKAIVDHDDNSEYKNTLNKKLQEINLKKANLKFAQTFFDLTEILVSSNFNKADDQTINLIDQEIFKINDYDNLSENVKEIVNHNENSEYKNVLNTRLHELQTKKANLESAQIYFDLTNVKDSTFFNKANDQTIDLIDQEIEKINDYDDLAEEVKAIVDHDDNLNVKIFLQTKLQDLKTKKTNLESAQTYFDLTDVQIASNFNKADDQTIDLIAAEISKINDYDDLLEDVKTIVDYGGNSEYKNVLNTRLHELQTKKTNLESAKTYFDLINVLIASNFNKADQTTIDSINQEIEKINNYDDLLEDVKTIVDHNDNSEYKNALNTRLQELEEKKANLLLSQIYFDLNEVQSSTLFNKVDDQTINSITIEINKINDYDNLSEEVKAIVDDSDNLEYKNALITRLQELISKKTNLELAKIYFDLTDVQNASNFNKADDQTIDLITDEINKINDYDDLLEDVKTIVDYSGNSEYKNVLNTRLHELQIKKANLELAKNYFDLTDIEDASNFNKADQITINSITIEINKINDYDDLADEIKTIVDHEINLDFKNLLQTRLQELEEKKANLESVKTYFDLTGVQNPSIFNKADQTTIDSINQEIEKIDNYDDLSDDVKTIVNHDDNSEYKDVLNTRLKELQEKKANLESAQNYLDLTNIQISSNFNKADQTTINLINQEIDQEIIKKAENYNNFSEAIIKIIEHSDNTEFNNLLKIRTQELLSKKANLESAQSYFDLTDVQDSSNFIKANDVTINLINQEIAKINDKHLLSENVKSIVDNNDNSEFNVSLNTRLQELEEKKANLELAKNYFDLTNVQNAYVFNKANDQTIDLITTEINKINDYDNLSEKVKAIVDHDDNSEFKNVLNTTLQELNLKKINLKSSQIYFDLTDIQIPSNFNKADQTTIDSINQEIEKIDNYDDLSDDVKTIVNHDDNSEYKNALNTRLEKLQEKKANLELAQTYFDNQKANTFNKADQTTIDSINQIITKINDYENFSNDLKTIIEHNDNYEFKVILDQELIKLNIKKELLQEAQSYFDLTDVQISSFFNKADDVTINLINQEINKINDYDNLSEEVKAIVEHNDNSEYKNALNEKITELETKKTNLESTKIYFDLTDVQIASFFNKADDQTINLINQEINKINDYDNLSEEVKAIVDHNDNSEYKNALNTRLQELQEKKANLELAQTYFNNQKADTFIKADQTTIDLITIEINKINDYENFSNDLKTIIEHNDNYEFKVTLEDELIKLNIKKELLQETQSYFDLTNVQDASNFNKADQTTINSITIEISKINDYDDLSNNVKSIVDHDDNSEYKNALQKRLQELQSKKTDLESIQTYFDHQKSTFFKKADDQTINLIDQEITEILDSYNNLSKSAKIIVDHDDNLEFKNELQELNLKKTNLESAKAYFDLTDVQIASNFNKADQTTIKLITDEINKINDYVNLSDDVKTIVDHNVNSEYKDVLNTRLQELEEKKANLELAETYFDNQKANTFNKADQTTIDSINQIITKINNYENFSNDLKTIIEHNDNYEFKVTLDQELIKLNIKKELLQETQTYFDLTDVQIASFFNKADDVTINLINEEISKINDYDDLYEEVKTIVDHDDNSEYKNALNTRLQELQEKKANLLLSQIYFDLTDVQIASFFNKVNDETIELINQEINKINDYVDLSEKVKAIVDHETNLDFKNLLQSRLQELLTKKTDLESAKTYFDHQKANTFNKADQTTIDLITTEINKINDYDNLSEEVKAIVEHNDNSELKFDLNEELIKLNIKKQLLQKALKYFDLTNIQEISTFNKADQTTIDLISQEIVKIDNYDDLSDDVKEIVEKDDNLEFRNALQNFWFRRENLELAKNYFDLTGVQNASVFNKVDDQTIVLINQEINKINDYDDLSDDVKAIVNHIDNSEFNNLLQTKLQELWSKELNLELVKMYFNIEESSFFNRADDATINSILEKINEINDYDNFSDDVKAIFEHSENSEFKNFLPIKLEQLQTKKTNLELAKAYFDLTDVQNTSVFNKADDQTINLITTEIEKINDYNDLSDNVKAIVDHKDNSEFKDALNTKLQELETQKEALMVVKEYFDITDIEESEIFNKADQTTIDLIDQEITKTNEYEVLEIQEDETIVSDALPEVNTESSDTQTSTETATSTKTTASTEATVTNGFYNPYDPYHKYTWYNPYQSYNTYDPYHPSTTYYTSYSPYGSTWNYGGGSIYPSYHHNIYSRHYRSIEDPLINSKDEIKTSDLVVSKEKEISEKKINSDLHLSTTIETNLKNTKSQNINTLSLNEQKNTFPHLPFFDLSFSIPLIILFLTLFIYKILKWFKR